MPYRALNPNANKFIKPKDYKDLLWQLSGKEPKVVQCRELKHKTKEFDNSFYIMRCTDVITICDECKYVYHTDMSD